MLLSIPQNLWIRIQGYQSSTTVTLNKRTPPDNVDLSAANEAWAKAVEIVNEILELPDEQHTLDTAQNNLQSRDQELQTARSQLNARQQHLGKVVMERDTFQTQHSTALQRIQELEEELQATQLAATNAHRTAEQQREIAAALAANRGSTSSTGKVTRMSDPEKFNGTRDKLRPFLTQLRLKLGENDAFPDLQSRLRYIVSRLEGSALDQVSAAVISAADGSTIVNFASVDAMLLVLTTAFDDPDRTGTAQRKLLSLRQTNKEFASYYAEFARLAADTNWDNNATKAILLQGLSNELKDALIHHDEPATMAELVVQCQRLDNRIRARRSDQSGNRSTNSRHIAQARSEHPGTAPTVTSATPIHPTSSNSGYGGPAPMDLSYGSRRLSREERMKRIAEGRCLYCGGHGHLAMNCPNKRSSIRAAGATTAPTPTTQTPPPLTPTAEEDESKN